MEDRRDVCRNAALRQRQSRNLNAPGPRRIQERPRAAAGIMQYRLDPMRHKGVTDVLRQARDRNHPVGGVGNDGKTLLGEFGRKVAREIGAREIEQGRGFLQPLRIHARKQELAQRVRVAFGRGHLGEPGFAGACRGMFAHREQWQLQEPMAFEFAGDGAQRIGAGDDDGVVARFVVVLERHRLEPQHRREQDLKTARPQGFGGRLTIRMRPCDENGHASGFRERHFDAWRTIALCDLVMLPG